MMRPAFRDKDGAVGIAIESHAEIGAGSTTSDPAALPRAARRSSD
jgi:hypothetical protein